MSLIYISGYLNYILDLYFPEPLCRHEHYWCDGVPSTNEICSFLQVQGVRLQVLKCRSLTERPLLFSWSSLLIRQIRIEKPELLLSFMTNTIHL